MPPARTRPLDDVRSETSSTATKDRPAVLGPASSPVPPKGKRVASSLNPNNLPSGTVVVPSSSKAAVSATAPPTGTTIDTTTDPNLPRIQWTTFPTSFLHTYRHVYQLGTPSSHTHPHADLVFASSRAGLRSPAIVAARRKALVKKTQEARRRQKSSDEHGKQPPTASKERERSSDRLKAALASNSNATSSSSANPGVNNNNQSSSTVPGDGGGGAFEKQPPHALAMAVRRHFNSQQVSEGDVIAKFVYVVRNGSGTDGDDKGFRLRFRP